ncbi:hypothetical protein [Mesorhizobium sp.]|uniref:hypothetical protein n=1 Tax=Mesorhizobium sp. TaxID=1871066 RepID=UPI00257E0327|nr:hypothetical protein [Mesorhizobium sp.]
MADEDDDHEPVQARIIGIDDPLNARMILRRVFPALRDSFRPHRALGDRLLKCDVFRSSKRGKRLVQSNRVGAELQKAVGISANDPRHQVLGIGLPSRIAAVIVPSKRLSRHFRFR